ncbi:c-type cytochrome [Sedimenticola hydrogenitrophicus]|uniref:c-type cytochrome n=1 Tax=Sedimenticola hydrogenitrophicus TaxID=2967975 RepID=UPI0023AF8632|nr:c-type cytochrome [Sedimenticola hydrogenitrophicus]
MKIRIIVAGLLSLLLVACSEEPAANAVGDQQASAAVRSWYRFDQVSAGARVYQENCAACHGKLAEGADNWRKAGPDGKYPAPPLNGSGHAWHHPLKILFHTIKNGSPGGQGNMPAWAGKLTDDEIIAAIAWFQSKWPQEIYQSWVQRDAAAQANRG